MLMEPLKLTPLPILHAKMFVEIIEYIKAVKELPRVGNKKSERLSDVLALEKAINHIIKKEYETGKDILLKLNRYYENKTRNFAEYLRLIFNDNSEEITNLLKKVYLNAPTLMNFVDIYDDSDKNTYITDESLYTFTVYTPYYIPYNNACTAQQYVQIQPVSPVVQPNNFETMFQTPIAQAHANAILERIDNSNYDRITLVNMIAKERGLSLRSASRYYKNLSILGLVSLVRKNGQKSYTASLTDKGENYVESIRSYEMHISFRNFF